MEAMELCNFGAKVVYPPTIYPAFHKNIPILIKNTFNPDAPGTIIRERLSDNTKPIKGISSINDTALITVQGLGMVGVIGVNHRIFRTLAQNGISVFLVSQASCRRPRRRTVPLSVCATRMPHWPARCSTLSLPRRLPREKSMP